ncbi:MAG: SocA family protein, partial [Desulfovibrionaceae bacterium]|nr:SocA family protein [Desulfovibrionaceae bacterium]
MSIEFSANHRKILEAIVYILSRHSREAKSIFILKCLYYADKYHLQQYACPITGDTFVKLKHGPCATNAYNILQGSELYLSDEVLASASSAFEVFDRKGSGDSNTVYKSIRDPDVSVFSSSDLECLN